MEKSPACLKPSTMKRVLGISFGWGIVEGRVGRGREGAGIWEEMELRAAV